MKNNLLFIIVTVSALMSFKTSNAQNISPFWSLAGNSNTGSSSRLGTTNKKPLKLITYDKTRLFIDTAGNVSIGNGGTGSAGYRFYVSGKGYGIYGTADNYGVVGNGIYGVYGGGSTYGVYGNGDSYGIYGYSSNGFGGEAYSYNSDGLDAYSINGDYGIYASCPNYIGVYGYGGSYGLYGNGASYGSYGYSSAGYGAYGSSYSGYGVYGSNYNGYSGGYFHSTLGYGLAASSDSNYYAAVFFGAVYSSVGFVTSDRNLKKNIKDFGNAMGIINKLQPKNYEFKDDAKYTALHLPAGNHYGLIAQDLEQVLPDLVHEENFHIPVNDKQTVLLPKTADGKDPNQHVQPTAPKTESIDVKAVNYVELIPIMIKAMQEQNQIIEEQNNKIDALTQKLNAITGSTQSVSNSSSARTSNSYLGQAVPNPAKNSASIYYNNIANAANAKLIVYDANGKMMKQMQLSKNGSGSINLDVSAFRAGSYTYVLSIDGNIADSKSMEIVR